MPLGAHLVLQSKGTPKDVVMGTSRVQEQLCPCGPSKPLWVLTQLCGTSLGAHLSPMGAQQGMCPPHVPIPVASGLPTSVPT